MLHDPNIVNSQFVAILVLADLAVSAGRNMAAATAAPPTNAKDEGVNVAITVLEHDATFKAYRPPLVRELPTTPRATQTSAYNAFRQRLLYQSARNSELQAHNTADRRLDYEFAREAVLSRRYPARNSSIIMKKPTPARARNSRHARQRSDASSGSTESDVDGSDFDGNSSGVRVADVYAFTGMHHIFTHHTKAVTRVKFGHDSRGLVAMASVDGSLSISNVMDSDPTRTVKMLREHISAVTDLDWSARNDLLLSCSLDATLRVWDTKTGQCIRTLDSPSPLLCCNFHPTNNNLLISGDKHGTVNVWNFSTSEPLHHAKVAGAVTAIAWQVDNRPTTSIGTPTKVKQHPADSPQILFLGCQTGEIHWFQVDREGNSFTQIGYAKVGTTAIASIQWRAQHTGVWAMPSLLVSQMREPTRLYAIRRNQTDSGASSLSASPPEHLEVYAEFPPASKRAYIRSALCPLLSYRANTCIVVGSENGTVYIHAYRPPRRIRRPGFVSPEKGGQSVQRSWMVNQLPGHAGVIYDVAWNADESLLASSDQDGLVIIWKRVLLKSPSTILASNNAAERISAMSPPRSLSPAAARRAATARSPGGAAGRPSAPSTPLTSGGYSITAQGTPIARTTTPPPTTPLTKPVPNIPDTPTGPPSRPHSPMIDIM